MLSALKAKNLKRKQKMVSLKDVRVTHAEIARDTDLELELVKAMLEAYEPLGVNAEGEQLYSIPQMMGALFRGVPNGRADQFRTS